MTEDTFPQPEPQVAHAPLAGVIGWPIAHSRSPALHGHWLRRYDLPGYYIPIPVRPENLAEVLHSLPRMGFVGERNGCPMVGRCAAGRGMKAGKPMQIGEKYGAPMGRLTQSYAAGA